MRRARFRGVWPHLGDPRRFPAAPLSPPEDPLTEVPEYLLRRSRERREALGLDTGGGDAPAASDAPPPASGPAAAPAVAATGPAAPAVSEPEPSPPAPPTYVAPAGPRSGIPAWMFP